jgi:hypothetical protein
MKTFPFRLLIIAALLTLVSACTCGAPCTPGAAACACKSDQSCASGLVCSPTNVCERGTVVGIQISDPSARGCEVLVTDQPGTVVRGAEFQDSVVGTSVVETPRSAISFVAAKDAAISGEAVQLLLTGPATGVTISRFSCVDVNGQKLPNANVTLR